jgi:hypothetical protein
MNWVIPLVQFLYGFSQGYTQSRQERQGLRQHGIENFSDGDYDWHEHMNALSATGATLVRVKPNSAMFELQVQGGRYPIILLRQGQTVLISACSGITFPSGRAPRDISAGLVRVNRRLERCDYELINGDDGDFYCVQARINLESLSPDAFYAGVNEMLPHVLVLDKYLLENGYAR